MEVKVIKGPMFEHTEKLVHQYIAQIIRNRIKKEASQKMDVAEDACKQTGNETHA